MTDAKKLQYYLDSPLMKRIVELKERDFADKDKFDYAPVSYDDAIENYKRIVEITDEVAKNIIEPNSESVDLEGPHLENNRMIYASKTYENLDATRKAGLWGITMPRRFGGLNLPHDGVLHALRARFSCRQRLPERVVAPKLHRHPLRVWHS